MSNAMTYRIMLWSVIQAKVKVVNTHYSTERQKGQIVKTNAVEEVILFNKNPSKLK